MKGVETIIHEVSEINKLPWDDLIDGNHSIGMGGKAGSGWHITIVDENMKEDIWQLPKVIGRALDDQYKFGKQARFQKVKSALAVLSESGIEMVWLKCRICDKKFMGEPLPMCCDGRECGCMGLPTEPAICSKKCGDRFNKLKKRTTNGE